MSVATVQQPLIYNGVLALPCVVSEEVDKYYKQQKLKDKVL